MVGLTFPWDLVWPFNPNSLSKYVECCWLVAFCKVKLFLEVAWMHTVIRETLLSALWTNASIWTWVKMCGCFELYDSMYRTERQVCGGKWEQSSCYVWKSVYLSAHTELLLVTKAEVGRGASISCLWPNNTKLKVFTLSSKSPQVDFYTVLTRIETSSWLLREKNKYRSLALKIRTKALHYLVWSYYFFFEMWLISLQFNKCKQNTGELW